MISVEASLAILVLVPVVSVIWTAACILVGFRMGRQVADKPAMPIIGKAKADPAGETEDPYFDAMHGKPAGRIQTVEE